MLGILVGMDQKDRYAARCFTVAVLGHAGDMPVVLNNRCLGFYSAEKLWRSRSCRSLQVADIPVVVQMPIPMVFLLGRPWRLRSCSIFPGGRCPCCAGRVPCPVCASGPCWAFSTTGYLLDGVWLSQPAGCRLLASRCSWTRHAVSSCNGEHMDNVFAFVEEFSMRTEAATSATWGSCKTSSCTVELAQGCVMVLTCAPTACRLCCRQ